MHHTKKSNHSNSFWLSTIKSQNVTRIQQERDSLNEREIASVQVNTSFKTKNILTLVSIQSHEIQKQYLNKRHHP